MLMTYLFMDYEFGLCFDTECLQIAGFSANCMLNANI